MQQDGEAAECGDAARECPDEAGRGSDHPLETRIAANGPEDVGGAPAGEACAASADALHSDRSKETELEKRMTKSLLRTYFYLSMPPFLSNFASALLIFVDGLVITNLLGTGGMASLTYAQTIDYFIRATGQIFCTGALSVLSTLIGNSQSHEYRDLVPSCLLWLTLLGSLFCYCVFLPCAGPLFRTVGARGKTLDDAIAYAHVLVYGSPLILFNMSYSVMLMAEGLSVYSMVCSLLSSVFNAPLSFLLIRYTNLGIRGGSLGSLMSVTMSASFSLYLYLSGRTVSKIRPLLVFSRFRESLRLSGRMFVVGVNDAFSWYAFGLTYSLLNYFVSQVAPSDSVDTALAAVGSVGRFYGMFNAIFLSFGSLGFLPIAGFFVGRRDKEHLMTLLRRVLLFISALMICVSALCLGLHRYLGMLFSTEAKYLGYFRISSLVSFPSLFLSGMQFVLISFGQALGTDRRLVICSFLCLVVYQPLLATILYFSTHSFVGLMFSFSGNDVLSIITCLILFFEPLRRPDSFIERHIQSIAEQGKKKEASKPIDSEVVAAPSQAVAVPAEAV